MDRRKIILFGKTAFCVTLPQAWVKKNKLQKGDSLGVQETPRNSLELIPEKNSPDEDLIADLEITNKSLEKIKSYLLSTYLNGYSVVVLNGSNIGKTMAIRKYIQELIATEVMEVTTNKMIINMFWDVTNTDLQTRITRIDNILKTMLTETKELISNEDNKKDIKQKGREVKRQVLLVRRVVTHALKDSTTAQNFNLSTFEIYYLSYFIYFLGQIGRLVVELASRIHVTKENNNINKTIELSIKRLLTGISDYFESVMEAFYKLSKNIEFDIHHYETFQDDLKLLQKQSDTNIALLSDSLNLIMMKIYEIEKIIINLETSPQ